MEIMNIAKVFFPFYRKETDDAKFVSFEVKVSHILQILHFGKYVLHTVQVFGWLS